METVVGAANWLLDKVLTKLSDELVATYVSSSQLGLNFQTIKLQLLYTQGLLHAAQGRDVSNNPGLCGLLEKLSKTADKADDMLDELHYFTIQDELDDTEEAAEEVQGGGLQGHALHGYRVVRHTIGNWFSYFLSTQDDNSTVAATAHTGNRHSTNMYGSDGGGCSNDDGVVDKLPFDRVAMSNKIKSVIQEMNSICVPISDLLKNANHNSTTLSTPITLKRPRIGSIVAQDKKLHGRSVIFEQTVNTLTSGTYHGETLSVLPIVGPGGIGKTTFTQHLYNDERVQGQFPVKVWVCVSTDFDVIKLTREILSCILATEKDTRTPQTDNLDQLQNSIVEKLKSKRFLIVMDDILKCNTEVDWKSLLAPFAKGETKGNMILVTTRFPSIAHLVKTKDLVELHGLEPKDFFALFEACIFGGHSKPEHYEDDLIDVAKDIARKLKGSPLAANTVGRLLKKNFSREYWMGVLEKNEWQNTKNDDDIMPSLKISYYYLPFHLKKCFSYCALFPEDYRFYSLEITSLWIAIGIIDSNCQNNNNYLEELVDIGFLIKGGDWRGEYYLMHDLMHELSRNVASQECASISSLSFQANDVPRSILHLSITVKYEDDEIFGEEIGKLKSIIDIGKLRSLLIFGSCKLKLANILKDTFKEIKGLRVMSIKKTYLPKNFSNLIHLRYLKLMSPGDDLEINLLSTLSRFYHLKFLDLQDCESSENLPNNISRLVNLRHFHSSKEFHSNIREVRKMKCLHELKKFHVKKESVGFELRQLGELGELGGELRICNLETVVSKEEASDARLRNKRDLKQLDLVWGREHQTVVDSDVIEGLEPPPNLRVLGIKNYGGVAGPSWLFGGISMQRLDTLYLRGVSWGTLPPFEQLPQLRRLKLKNIRGMRVFAPSSGGVTETNLMNLKTIVIKDMLELEEWVGGPNSPLVFSRLERIKCINCPLLSSFSFLECCINLCELGIRDCPVLMSHLPPLPHTCAITDMYLGDSDVDSSFLKYDRIKMTVNKYTGALAFQNMDGVEVLTIKDSEVPLSFSELQKLNFLRSLSVNGWEQIFHTEVAIGGSFQLEELEVDSIWAVLTAPFCSSLAATLRKLSFVGDRPFETFREEQEQALYLLTSLQCLRFIYCYRLRSLPRGLYRLSSLKELSIQDCDGIQSLPPKDDLPLASMQILNVRKCSDEIKEQAKKLKEANPSLLVQVDN